MAKTYQYCVAENWGKGFIDHVESQRITFAGYPANLWIAKVAGVVKTKDEAQALVDAEIQAAQAAWDALPDDQKTEMNPRPADVTLEE
jgi:hypothetical protein